jgi:pilus assembly protein CpaE
MNAPWKPGAPRDSFAAYVCDDASLDVLRPLVADFGWAPEKCTRGGAARCRRSVTSSPAILLVDLSESGDPLGDINALAEVCEPGTVVIAIGQVNDVRLYRDLLASGIHDYLLKPLSAASLRDTLTQAQAIFAAPRSAEPGQAKAHLTTAVIGTRGGWAPPRWPPRSPGCFPKSTSSPPPCSIWISISAPARFPWIWSRAAA